MTLALATRSRVGAADLTPQELEELAEVIEDPYLFVSIMLGMDVWEVPRRILESMAQPRARVAVKACHASSKTWTATKVMRWFLARHADGIVVTTAPTQSQVRDVFWEEVRRDVASSRFTMPTEPNLQDWRLDDGNFAIGRATNAGVRMQGFHGRVLFIVDEAPGVTDGGIWEAIEGVAAGGDVRVLALGNPTVSSGPFYDLYERNTGAWELITIDAQDTPNFRGIDIEELARWPVHDPRLDVCTHPYLITRRWVWERAQEWGTDSPQWASRVRGRFPDQGDSALIARSWIDAAASRPAEDDGGRITVGIDVAGPGEDETVAYVVNGPNILSMGVFTGDARGAVTDFLEPWRARHDRVYVDTAGLGYYFERHLKDAGYRTHGVNVGEASHHPEKYANLKAQLYWGLRERFRDGHANGLTDPLTRSQLAGILWEQDARNRIAIESKEDARKRGVKSPDRAEALMLAWSNVEPGWLAFVRGENEARKAE